MYKDFDALINAKLKKEAPLKRAVIAGAADEHAIEAVFLAQDKGYAYPVLIGEKRAVTKIIGELGFSDRPYEIVHCEEGYNPSEIAVKLIHESKGDFIMKGRMETKDFLKPILNKTGGLNKSGFITHFGLMQLKSYHKLLAMSDSAVIPYPTLEDKVKIAQTGIDALCKLGYKNPVVAALCAVETVSEKIPETVDAEKLARMSDKEIIKNGKVIGPISYDLATQKQSAQIKGYDSPYAGDVDMLLVPQMVTGNVISKIFNYDTENILAGCLLGADIPVGLTSRSAGMNEKMMSVVLCNLLS